MMEMDCWESYICVNSINIYIVLWVIYPIFAALNLFSSKDFLLLMSKELINNLGNKYLGNNVNFVGKKIWACSPLIIFIVHT